MSQLIRFGVSLDRELLKKFDAYVRKNRYKTRSKAISDLIGSVFVGQEWEKNKETAGAIVLVYDHHKRELVNKVIDIQHDFQKIIISSQHVHLDYSNCMEVIIVRGRTSLIQNLASLLKSTKGVKYSSILAATTGKNL
ncbi:MAG: nickel-responsive transcriptional regulator NikR [Candidatus Goldbacteria bacterium]|nr:nickel-responsive transcriptional regulator NikR [Candidatus Goldiibacteriota bacterium]HPD19554.1 nickel-responsive transcriptional regulator NikR [Candidatus Goldiibacteriota bacterium]